ncbi:hypothetical protein X560_2523 [Listeria fleischmannii 1991]|uniref:Uncharacterized protein conserved in bacteria n=2 Tax=Listeria fleischmannii TaxID=1069827 RepID=A0A2X3HEX8_9LIST|nr:DUF1697 domain-containing protein [Listeria fleischmannii]EMG26641.1 hypothetical protein LFLEISCH_15431 [Listeria fleischmannii subsp. fleischmannii LU2006-1]KMT57982.1 hypothetical protein X560_2523 [Listeria fleischmannii 1991]SQC71127.1 Uncharacterized protein conserved in bacteria [Listeria fleischmannii subsp. fleischmannii]
MKFVVLLRAINVGGHNKVKMAELRESLAKEGFRNVKTYIQSGNLILEASFSKQAVRGQIEQHLNTYYAIQNATVVVLEESEYRQVLAQNPFTDLLETERLMIFYQNGKLDDNEVEEQDASYVAKDQAIYVKMKTTKIHEVKTEKVIKTWTKEAVTGRNLKTSEKLLDLLN